MLKLCCKCREEKLITEFYVSRKGRNLHGVQSKCKSCIKLYNREYRIKNPDKIKTWKALDVSRHYDKRYAKKEEWRKNNPDRCKISTSKSHKRHKKEMTNYYISKILRHRFWLALRGQNTRKHESAISLLGCSIEQARDYIASGFHDGMSWDNYGKWEIDHIKPCASFDLKEHSQQKICFHHSNLQPLWMSENRSKGKRYDKSI
jgi:hypothetical protein